MKKKIISTVMLVVILGVSYFFFKHHLVFYGSNVKLLKKQGKLTLNQTFVSVEDNEFRGPKDFLMDDALREAGLGEVLVEYGILTEDELEILLEEIEEEKFDDY